MSHWIPSGWVPLKSVKHRDLKNGLNTRWDRRDILLTLVTPAGLASGPLLILSYFTTGWTSDFTMNAGFLFVGILVAALYVDWAVKRYEERQWVKPRSIALIRIRRSATRFVNTVSLHLTGENKEQALRFQPVGWKQRADPLNYQRELYSNPEWIAFVRHIVIPHSIHIGEEDDPETLGWLIKSVEHYFVSIKEHMTLFASYLGPTQIDNLAALMDRIPLENGPYKAVKERA